MARNDAIGLFWEDLPKGKGAKVARIQPPIPDTGWVAPTYFPDLSRAKVLAIDVETYDPDLLTRGPGWARGSGHIVGVSVAADASGRWYFPIRHTVEPETNLSPDAVLAWLRDSLVNKAQPKVGANLMYDVGWLRHEGVRVAGPLIDVQYAEALLHERAKTALEAMGKKYLNEGKATSLLYQWCADYYGGPPDEKQRGNIYRAPPRLVGHYAESDVDLPLRLAPILYQKLNEEGLLQVFDMECRLIPLLLDMRFKGVRVDVGRAEQLREVLLSREKELHEQLDKMAGETVDINSSVSLANAFDNLGIPYLTTAKGNPSFTKAFLAGVQHPIANHISEIRKNEKLRSTFVESYILDNHVNGMVYGQFHPLRGDDGGTRSGRFSSSTPNLQNIPSRDEELAPLVRGLFIPDEGHAAWRKYDYSQIEYRFLIHFAVGPGSLEAVRLFNQNPDTDYHEYALDLVAPEAGWEIHTPELRKAKRKPVKNINFGLIFGMGIAKLALDLGISKKQAEALFAAYHRGVPFAKATMNQCSEEAERTGTITTILGRKSRFDLWQPTDYEQSREVPALPYEEAMLQYGRVKRAYTHKALNRRLQGSAADLMKLAMLRCYEDGVFDVTGVPRLTVHDELDFSDPGGAEDGFAEVVRIMETAIPLRIPVKADGEIGPDWGHVKDI